MAYTLVKVWLFQKRIREIVANAFILVDSVICCLRQRKSAAMRRLSVPPIRRVAAFPPP